MNRAQHLTFTLSPDISPLYYSKFTWLADPQWAWGCCLSASTLSPLLELKYKAFGTCSQLSEALWSFRHWDNKPWLPDTYPKRRKTNKPRVLAMWGMPKAFCIKHWCDENRLGTAFTVFKQPQTATRFHEKVPCFCSLHMGDLHYRLPVTLVPFRAGAESRHSVLHAAMRLRRGPGGRLSW